MSEDNDLRIKLEEVGIESEKIDEFMSSFDMEKKKEPSDEKILAKQVFELQSLLDDTPKSEWRKRAQISARIINLKNTEY